MNHRLVATLVFVVLVLSMFSVLIGSTIAQEDGMMRLLKVHTPSQSNDSNTGNGFGWRRRTPTPTPTSTSTVQPTSEPWPTVVPDTPVPPPTIEAGVYLVQLKDGVQEEFIIIRFRPRHTSSVVGEMHHGKQYFLYAVEGDWYQIITPWGHGYVESSKTEVTKK